jgi:hypothetical protein
VDNLLAGLEGREPPNWVNANDMKSRPASGQNT